MVVIRLSPAGRKHQPVYRIFVADQRAKLTGRFLEKLGTYQPSPERPYLKLDQERYDFWVSKGAIPTDSVKKIVKDLKDGRYSDEALAVAGENYRKKMEARKKAGETKPAEKAEDTNSAEAEA